MKRSAWQLAANSTSLSRTPLHVATSSSRPLPASSHLFHRSRQPSCLAKTQGPKRSKRGTSRKGSTPSSARPGSSCGQKRDLSIPIPVPEHKRLRASQVKPVTLGRYLQAVTELEQWAADHRKSLGPAHADRSICVFLHDLCEQGRSIVDARSTVYGFILLRCDSSWPEKFLLSQSKAAIKGWCSRFPVHSRAAVDLQVWDVIAWKCWQNNCKLASAAILLQGDLYLRPCEVRGLRKHSVIKPVSARSTYWGVVLAQQEEGVPTKTGTFDDCVLLDTVCRSDLHLVLKWLYNQALNDDALLSLG